MEERRKRKAKDQLSPYSNAGDEGEQQDTAADISPVASRRRAKARVGDSSGIANPGMLKGVLSSVELVRPRAGNDRISGLNRCFVSALQRVIETESNKNLSYLFSQYEKYYEELSRPGS